MINKYNIALLPEKLSQTVIHYASHFIEISDKYLLGEGSLPHVTICQFEAAPSAIDGLIKKLSVSDILKTMELTFDRFSCLSFDDVVHWVSLMPNKVEELQEMHRLASSLVDKQPKRNYDPHMTLMSTRNGAYQLIVDHIKQSYHPMTDRFVLSVGESDDVGQYINVLYEFHQLAF